MSWRLERHLYAPELNKLHLTRKDGSTFTFDAPGITSMRAFREQKLRPQLPTICAVLTCTYHDPQHQWLNARVWGSVTHRKDVLKHLKKMRERHNAGPRDIKCRTFLIG